MYVCVSENKKCSVFGKFYVRPIWMTQKENATFLKLVKVKVVAQCKCVQKALPMYINANCKTLMMTLAIFFSV